MKDNKNQKNNKTNIVTNSKEIVPVNMQSRVREPWNLSKQVTRTDSVFENTTDFQKNNNDSEFKEWRDNFETEYNINYNEIYSEKSYRYVTDLIDNFVIFRKYQDIKRLTEMGTSENKVPTPKSKDDMSLALEAPILINDFCKDDLRVDYNNQKNVNCQPDVKVCDYYEREETESEYEYRVQQQDKKNKNKKITATVDL